MRDMLSDIEIARAAKLRPIAEIAARIGVPDFGPLPLRPPRSPSSNPKFLESLVGPAGRQADSRHRDQPDAGWRRQDDDHRRPRRRAEPHRQEGDHLPARALARALLRPEGRRDRRRPRPGRADGRDQSPFHRRFPRHHIGAQSAGRDDRQSRLLGQRARTRSAARRLAARARHERPRAARDRHRARRPGQRLSARGRLRHHRRLRGDGGVLPRSEPRGARGAARPHDRRLDPTTGGRSRRGPQGARAR